METKNILKVTKKKKKNFCFCVNLKKKKKKDLNPKKKKSYTNTKQFLLIIFKLLIKKTAITANQEEKITVKIATQQKPTNLASLTSIDKSVNNGATATLSLKSVNNSSSYSHNNNNNSNKSQQQQQHQQQQYQQRFHNKPHFNNTNNSNGFQQKNSNYVKNNNYNNSNSNNNNNNNNNINLKNNKNIDTNIGNFKGNIKNNNNAKIDVINNGQLNGDKIYNNSNNSIVGVINTSTTSTSENFSYDFSKNFAKIRQHDSDVSPRPRRPYQNDPSSRYYNKSSDGTGQGRIISGDTVNPRNLPTSISEAGGGGGGGGGRRQFINSNTDYNNSLNQSSGYNNRSITPPDPIKGGGFNNSINNSNNTNNSIGGGGNVGGQQSGTYINKNHVRSNSLYQQQPQQQQQYNSYNNRYNNGRENNYYNNKYNENGGSGAGGRPQYNRGIGNNGPGESRDYSPSASPNLNGGPRLGQLQRNIGGENNRGLPNNLNNRGPSSQYDNNGPRRSINNSANNNYNSLERGDRLDRVDRDRIERFDRDRGGFDRNDRGERIDRSGNSGPVDRLDRERSDRPDRDRLERGGQVFDRSERSDRDRSDRDRSDRDRSDRDRPDRDRYDRERPDRDRLDRDRLDREKVDRERLERERPVGIDRVGGIGTERLDRERIERGDRSDRPIDRFDNNRLERGPLPSSVLRPERPDSRSTLLAENNSGRQPYQGRDSGNYSPQSSSASPVGGSPKRDDIKGNGGTSKSDEKSVDRWIPPSLRPQHVLSQKDKNDAVFRKVRGILNKLTPEKFHELCEQLLKIDLKSTPILNGVILLIFDKAIDEPKYSSMYAQVCKRLKDEVANLEESSSHHNTFLTSLLSVCRDKFVKRSTNSNLININNTKTSNNNKTSENNSKNTNNNTNYKFDSNNLSEKDREYYERENDDDFKTEEEERRHIAKQRMLGNVKFIGELSKLQLLSQTKIHLCIQELLDKKKGSDATLQDWCEDMECLCQLIRTCGKDMDTEPSKKLMDQYFAEMDKRSKSTEYPPRIRFMLKDIIELRENNWVPRKVIATEGPVPIRQIRTDDDNVIRPPYINRNRDLRNNDRENDHWMNRLQINLQSSNFNDMFSSLSVTSSSPMMSPGGFNNRNQRNNQNNYNNYNNNRYNKHNNQLNNLHNNNSVGSGLTGNNQFNMLNNKDLAPRFKKSLMTTAHESIENIQMRPQTNSLLFKANLNIKPPMLPISTPLTPSSGNSSSNGNNNTSGIGLGSNNSSLTSQQQSISSFKLDNSSSNGNNMGPGIVLSVTNPPMSRNTGGGNSNNSNGLNESSLNSNSHTMKSLPYLLENSSSMANSSSSAKDSDIMLLTKHGSTEKTKGKKEKGPGKDEILKRVAVFLHENVIGAEIKEKKIISEISEEEKFDTPKLEEVSEESPENQNGNDENNVVNNIQEEEDTTKTMDEIVSLFYEMKISDKHMKDTTYTILNEILDKSEQDHAHIIEFLQILRNDNKLQSSALLEAIRLIINKMNEKESTIPRIATIVASLVARSVKTKLCKLSDISVYTEGGQHYPLILLVLQQLHKTMGRDPLEDLFQQSKVNLMASLPEADRNKDRLAAILEDRNLTFLYPLLKVQQEMFKQIQTDDNPQAFYKWIRGNVDAKYHKDSGFITALMTVILKYVTQKTTLIEGTNIKKPPEKSLTEKEEILFQKYCHILEAFVTGNTHLQLISVYALQVFCNNAEFPKGMLLRWFKNLYEANVVEEEAFLRWKEEVNDEYPDKGQALFQVHQWLAWLEQAESEEED